ncbi:hypothetical protein CNR22_24365 [Sphingobacteriaceae bacterium]|nr:hypothetical protein CNR22_24365 [Sphingobacteriaceae bacterium]
MTIHAQFAPSSVSGTFNYTLKDLTTSAITGPGTTNTFAVSTGNYSVTVTANSCATSMSFTVKKLDNISLSFQTSEPNCHGPGYVMVLPSGGDGSYSYKWYMNGSLDPTTSNVLSLVGITGQSTITATVNDQSGCSASGPTPAIVVDPSSIVTLYELQWPLRTGYKQCREHYSLRNQCMRNRRKSAL